MSTSYFQLVATALQFITRIPLPKRYRDNPFNARMVIAFPMVGLLLGGIAALVFLATHWLFGELIASLMVVIFMAMITGGFHLDGLADTADGLFSSRKREQMLEIMRDSRIGSNGALALIFAIILWIFAIDHIALTSSLKTTCFAIVAAPIVSRTLVVTLFMYKQRYARSEGLGDTFIGHISLQDCQITLFLGVILLSLFCGFTGLLYSFLVAGVALLYRALVNHRLGGQTGDTLGGAIIIIEIVYLLFC